ncbi:MAG: hypothetical protein IJF71_06460 [Clostridia bacterium]|nr:hypothetical protein [Clostridia bacterium]
MKKLMQSKRGSAHATTLLIMVVVFMLINVTVMIGYNAQMNAKRSENSFFNKYTLDVIAYRFINGIKEGNTSAEAVKAYIEGEGYLTDLNTEKETDYAVAISSEGSLLALTVTQKGKTEITVQYDISENKISSWIYGEESDT